jgi:hypothetical protein
MKPVIIILAILMFIGCMALGSFAGDLSLDQDATASPPPEQLTPTFSTANQRNLVVIQVDDLQAPSPRLVALWLVMYTRDASHLVMMLLHPLAGTDPANPLALRSQPLVDAFALTGAGEPDGGFLLAIQNRAARVDGYFVLDDRAMRAWVDWLGGIDAGGALLNGDAFQQQLAAARADAGAAIQWQPQLVGGLCARVTALNAASNWLAALMPLTPAHLRTNLSLEMAMQDWSRLTAGPDPLSCEFQLMP